MTLQEAKKLFISYDCSKFAIARENVEQYEEYKKLNIEKEVENEWREEKLVSDYQMIINNPKDGNNWMIFNKMYNLVEVLKNSKSIEIMQKSYELIRNFLDENEKVVIAETILGRKAIDCRSGLIFISYDIGNKYMAELFGGYITDLINYDFEDDSLMKRVNNISTKYKDISKELSL